MEMPILAALLFCVGLVIGPWLGIIVDRAVERERPELDHRCPECGTSLGGTSALIPVMSWWRRCATDPAHSARRYVLVDVALAIGFALVGLRFGIGWELGPYLGFVAALVVMSVVDLETHLLLDLFTLRVLPLALVMLLLLHPTAENGTRTWPALVGALTFGLILAILFIVYPPGLGFGDVKLAPTLGLFLGWLTTDLFTAVRLVIYALLVANLISGVGVLLWRWIRRKPLRSETPMGPSLAVGTLLVVVLSHPDLTGLLG